ncbi:MAG: 2,3,4,5-tetrahydropyridine-2,6-dicarboxylate N-succinyltransferase, partial [uncultured Craurococcus sp.]
DPLRPPGPDRIPLGTPRHRLLGDARRGPRRGHGRARGAGCRPGTRRRAGRRGRRLAGEPVAEAGRAAVLPPHRFGADGHRRRGLRQGAAEIRRLGAEPLQGGGLPRRPRRRGAQVRPYRAGRRADAELRQCRRLCRPQHHGRYLGDRRLLRADRPELPHLRRRRHRRRAGAAAGQPRRHRGRLLHRRPLGGRRGRHRRARRGAVHGRLPRRLHQDHRPRDGRGACRPRPGLFGGGARQPARPAAAGRLARPLALLRRHRQARRCADARQDQHQRVAARL